MVVQEDMMLDGETSHSSAVVSNREIEGDGPLTAVRRQTLIQRTTYRLAGQTIAVKVSGSPTNDGLYYVHSDHLGSASVLSNAGGAVVPGSEARYLPFGDWRTQPTSNPALTDMGFTGHKHNNSGSNDLGLIYMNARYYVPGIGRFASADTIVPDPANPQSFNRCSYVYNNPVRLVDPSGHCGADRLIVSGVDVGVDYGAFDQCKDIRTTLEDAYGISIIGQWMLAEMMIMQAAFQILRDTLSENGVIDSVQAISEMLSGAEIMRDRKRGSTITTCYDGLI